MVVDILECLDSWEEDWNMEALVEDEILEQLGWLLEMGWLLEGYCWWWFVVALQYSVVEGGEVDAVVVGFDVEDLVGDWVLVAWIVVRIDLLD